VPEINQTHGGTVDMHTIQSGDNQPLISIVMPFLNTSKYLEEAVESVLKQTYTAWELLMVDDGSTDGSSEIALAYAHKHPGKVRYMEHEGHANRGASASRNFALRNSNGKYIAFLDGDDVWLPSNLESLAGIMEANPRAAMVYGPTRWWYSWTGKPEDRVRDHTCQLGVQPNALIAPPNLFIPFFLTQKAITPCTCSLLVRREVANAVGIFEEEFRYIYTDQVFYAKLALQVPIYVTDQCGALYRQHPASSCAMVEKSGEARAARQKFLTWLERYLTERGNTDPKIWQALRTALWANRHPVLQRLLTISRSPLTQLKRLIKRVGWALLPPTTRRWLKAQAQTFENPI
jgi:glycosyltransferase involved in cell wall biosynthesis